MKNAIRGLGVASLLALGSAGFAHADPMMMAQSWAACNSSYMQCLSASDAHMPMSPQEGMSKFQMNMSHAQQCAAALQACYASVK